MSDIRPTWAISNDGKILIISVYDQLGDLITTKRFTKLQAIHHAEKMLKEALSLKD